MPTLPPVSREDQPPTTSKASWASLVKPKGSQGLKLCYIKPEVASEGKVFLLPKTLATEGSKAGDNTLVGYFIGKRLPYSLVKSATLRLWSKAGLIDMLATDSGYFYFKFNSREDCEAILEGGPWHIAGQPILLRKWQTGLKLSKEAPTTVPIWVHIYDIPLEYWNADGLSHIASILGKPLHVDSLTASCRRISYARICIEVSAEEELMKSFVIQTEDPISGDPELITLHVEYQWTPVRCAKCKIVGHNCTKLPHAQKV